MSRLKSSRLGEINNNIIGEKMIITRYDGAHKIEVTFENGNKVQTKYKLFKDGLVYSNNRPCKMMNTYAKYIGKKTVAKNGLKCEIIEYINAKNVKVKFEDGIIVTTRIENFRNRIIKHPNISTMKICKKEKAYKNHIGLEGINNDGLKMKIIEYTNANNFIVEFEDGFKVKTDIKSFKEGKVSNKNDNRKTRIKEARTGEQFFNSYGEKIEIIEYINSKNVIIKFLSNGAIKKANYANIRLGNVMNPESSRAKEIAKKYNGMSITAKNGMKMTIVNYQGEGDVEVEFEDGYKCKTRMSAFKNGNVCNPARPMRYFPHIVNGILVTSIAYATNEGPQMYVNLPNKQKDVMSWEEIYAYNNKN